MIGILARRITASRKSSASSSVCTVKHATGVSIPQVAALSPKCQEETPSLTLPSVWDSRNHKSARHPPLSPTSWLGIACRGRQTPRSSTSSTSDQCLRQIGQVITPPLYRVCRSEYARHTKTATATRLQRLTNEILKFENNPDLFKNNQ